MEPDLHARNISKANEYKIKINSRRKALSWLQQAWLGFSVCLGMG